MAQIGRGLFARVVLVLATASLAACATAPTVESGPAASGPVFYPALPNPPRIQHLKTIRGERDLGSPESDFAKFVVGEDNRTQQLQQPYGVAVHGGKLYVVDTKMPGLAVFDLASRRFKAVTGGAGGRMKRPINITIDDDGTKYVTDTGRNQVLVFDAADQFVQAFGAQGQFKPVDTAVKGGRLYVADIDHHEVQVLDKRTGQTMFKFGKAGSKEGELFQPTNMAFGPEGDLYVVETGNFRVQRFTPEGRPVRMYGELGAERGNFSRPKGIAIDREGRLYVGDSAFENVQIFDNAGRLLLFFGQPGEKQEGLNLPAGIVIDYGNVGYFQADADPRFRIEYLIFVVSQFEPNKVDVFGFGRMAGYDYGTGEAGTATPTPVQR